MEIVINIPDSMYHDAKRGDYGAIYANLCIANAIVNGRVLPKGHGDLIDRSKLTLSNFECVMCNGDFKEGLRMYIDKVDRADAVVPAEKVESATEGGLVW